MRKRGVSLRADLAWLAAAVVLPAVAAAALTVGGLAVYAAAGLAGLAAVLAGVKWPRTLIGATLLTALFVQTAGRLLPVPGVSSLDEGFVALCVVCILAPAALSDRLRWLPGLGWFGAFVALGLLSSVAAGAPLAVTGQGLLLAVKGILVGWAALQLTWDHAALKRALQVAVCVFGFALACAAVNAAIPGPWTALIGSPSEPEFRGPFPSLIGPWTHPSHFGQVMALCAVAALAYRQVFNRGGRLWVAAGAVAALLSFRRKTLFGLGAALAALTWRRTPAVLVLIALPALAMVVIAGWETIRSAFDVTVAQYVFDADETPRNVLLEGSVVVADRHFPFGAGFGRYGSYTAFEHYSPEYTQLGFPRIWGLRPGDPDAFFASDTFWPAVWGETGWLGALAYAAGLVGMALVVKRSLRHPDLWVRFLAVTATGWFIALGIESIAAPVFTGPPTYPLLFTLVGILASAGRASDQEERSDSAAATASSRVA